MKPAKIKKLFFFYSDQNHASQNDKMAVRNFSSGQAFWCQAICFCEQEIISNHFQRPQVDLKVKNGMQEVQNHFKEEISNFASGRARDLVLVSNTMFFGTGNQFRTSPEASDWPEGQDQAVLAVGVQQSLHGVTHLLSNPCYTKSFGTSLGILLLN